jgi:hypothetical protein
MAGKGNAIGLIAFAAGILLQIIAGIRDYPSIPPGIFIGLIAAGFVAFGSRWRWTSVIGLLAAIFFMIGAWGSITSGSAAGRHMLTRLTDPAAPGFVGTVIQMAGLLLALVGGALAAVSAYRRKTV